MTGFKFPRPEIQNYIAFLLTYVYMYVFVSIKQYVGSDKVGISTKAKSLYLFYYFIVDVFKRATFSCLGSIYARIQNSIENTDVESFFCSRLKSISHKFDHQIVKCLA